MRMALLVFFVSAPSSRSLVSTLSLAHSCSLSDTHMPRARARTVCQDSGSTVTIDIMLSDPVAGTSLHTFGGNFLVWG